MEWKGSARLVLTNTPTFLQLPDFSEALARFRFFFDVPRNEFLSNFIIGLAINEVNYLTNSAQLCAQRFHSLKREKVILA